MDIEAFIRKLQGHFTDGLVTIVGSGLSCAEGLPSMGELASHLISSVKSTDDGWLKVTELLKAGEGLEAALLQVMLPEDIITNIVRETASLVRLREAEIVEEVLGTDRKLKLSYLLPQLSPNDSQAHTVITTNYDRLVEMAAEDSGWGVDTLTVGHCFGVFDKKLSRLSFLQSIENGGKRRVYRKRITLCKPHGSLDWFKLKDKPIRSSFIIESTPLIITPGLGKYQAGYEAPYDLHRTEANQAIDSAARFLILGYGFNDDHLETHLKPQLKSGKPCLVLTKALSENCKKLLKVSTGMICLSEGSKPNSTLVTTSDTEFVLDDSSIWDVSEFAKKILAA